MSPLSSKQKLRIWANEIASCSKCDISNYCDHKVTHFLFTPRPKPYVDILFIGEAPGESEYLNQEPFIGPSGTCLREIIDDAVPNDISFCITNSILCTPFTDSSRYTIGTPSLSEVKECSPHLQSLYRKIKPKYIIALGKVAEKAVIHLSKTIHIPHYIQVLHPSKILQSKDYHYQFEKASLAIQEYLKK